MFYKNNIFKIFPINNQKRSKSKIKKDLCKMKKLIKSILENFARTSEQDLLSHFLRIPIKAIKFTHNDLEHFLPVQVFISFLKENDFSLDTTIKLSVYHDSPEKNVFRLFETTYDSTNNPSEILSILNHIMFSIKSLHVSDLYGITTYDKISNELLFEYIKEIASVQIFGDKCDICKNNYTYQKIICCTSDDTTNNKHICGTCLAMILVTSNNSCCPFCRQKISLEVIPDNII